MKENTRIERILVIYYDNFLSYSLKPLGLFSYNTLNVLTFNVLYNIMI